MIEKYQSHEQEQSADHGYEQIGISRADRVPGLLVNDPGKGGKGQNFEEYKSRHQVRREHDALHRAQREQDKEAVAAQVFPLMGKIFRGEHRRPHPHDRRDHGIDRPESDDTQRQAAAGQDPGDHQRSSRSGIL